MNSQQKAVLTTYHNYTRTFQKAYEEFVGAIMINSHSKPDTATSLEFYNEPCMFVNSNGVDLYESHEQLAVYFRQVMRNMKANDNLRSDLGKPRLTFLGESCALLSVKVVRVNKLGKQYEESGATYTMCFDQGVWKIVVVTVHPCENVFGESVE